MKAKETAVVLGIVTALGAGCTYNAGYNALETAVTNESAIRNRALTNVDGTAGNVTVGHSGLNEVTDGRDWYGDNVLTVAKKGSKQSLAVTARGVQGDTSTMIGIRDTALMEALGGYGHLSVQSNGDAINLTAQYGRPVGKWSLELYQISDFPFAGKPTHWTELQANRDLGKHVAVFARVEMSDFKARQAAYMLGLTVRR